MNNSKLQEWTSEKLSQVHIMDYKAFNFVDGEGVRCSLYVAGCPSHCEGCYNVAAWNFWAGVPYTQELELLSLLDILVDGRFDRTKRDLTLQFRGSSNQRIIDVSKSLASQQVVIWEKLVR